MPAGISGLACWRDWQRGEITPHDGFVGSAHPRLHKVFDSAKSATSLRAAAARSHQIRAGAMRLAGSSRTKRTSRSPSTRSLSATLSMPCFAVWWRGSKAGTGSQAPRLPRWKSAICHALSEIAKEWEGEQPVPPAVIWRSTLERVSAMSSAALSHPLPDMPGQKSWTEIPFGALREVKRTNLPWDVAKAVEVPGTGIRIARPDRSSRSCRRRQARARDRLQDRPIEQRYGERCDQGRRRVATLPLCVRRQDAHRPAGESRGLPPLSACRGGRTGALSIADDRHRACRSLPPRSPSRART